MKSVVVAVCSKQAATLGEVGIFVTVQWIATGK
jgi:hypothetical protein